MLSCCNVTGTTGNFQLGNYDLHSAGAMVVSQKKKTEIVQTTLKTTAQYGTDASLYKHFIMY